MQENPLRNYDQQLILLSLRVQFNASTWYDEFFVCFVSVCRIWTESWPLLVNGRKKLKDTRDHKV